MSNKTITEIFDEQEKLNKQLDPLVKELIDVYEKEMCDNAKEFSSAVRLEEIYQRAWDELDAIDERITKKSVYWLLLFSTCKNLKYKCKNT